MDLVVLEVRVNGRGMGDRWSREDLRLAFARLKCVRTAYARLAFARLKCVRMAYARL